MTHFARAPGIVSFCSYMSVRLKQRRFQFQLWSKNAACEIRQMTDMAFDTEIYKKFANVSCSVYEDVESHHDIAGGGED